VRAAGVLHLWLVQAFAVFVLTFTVENRARALASATFTCSLLAVLYEKLLRESLVFLDNALKGDWKEAQDIIVTITEACPRRFAVYAKFLLTGLMFTHQDDSDYLNASLAIGKKRSDVPDPINFENSCKYHEHTLRDEPCYKAKYAWLKSDNGSTCILCPCTRNNLILQ
jgi:hypothetical protein